MSYMGVPSPRPFPPVGERECEAEVSWRSFSTWCPKAIAAIGRLPETLADRCIVITMQRKRPGEKCERLKNLSGAYTRLQCERFVEENAKEIGWGRKSVSRRHIVQMATQIVGAR